MQWLAHVNSNRLVALLLNRRRVGAAVAALDAKAKADAATLTAEAMRYKAQAEAQWFRVLMAQFLALLVFPYLKQLTY